MPLLKLNENRYINTEHITDISYMPPGGTRIILTVAGAPPDEQAFRDVSASHGAVLEIELRNKERLPLRLEGAEADTVWAAFQAIQQEAQELPEE